MPHHRFNILAELIIGDLAAKIGPEIFSKDLMDRKCNLIEYWLVMNNKSSK